MNNIKILRTERNLSQAELANKVHVTQTAVSQWEKGKTNPDMQTANALASLFNVSVDYLFGRISDRKLSYCAHNIHDSPFIQGPGSLVVNSNAELTLEEKELVRIYRSVSVKARHELLACAFNIEKSEQEEVINENI